MQEKKEKKESKRSGGTKKERVDEQPPAAESPSSSSASATPAPSATTPEAPAAEAEADASSSSTVDTKEVLRKGRSILGDFLETRDAKDAQEAMAELGLSEKEGELAGRLVGAWLEDALQRKGEQMALLADLVVALHEAMLLGPGAIETGLRPTLEGLADLRVDVPKLEEWLASALARMVEGGALLLGFLQAAPQQMVEDGVAASFAAKVIEQLQGRVGQERAKEMVAAAKIDLKPLVGPDAEDAEAEVAALMEKLALV